MTSYRTGVSGNRRAAARLVSKVHRTIQKAYEASRHEGVTQTSIANALGVHRSVINRQLNGREDISVGRVAEFAWALGCDVDMDFRKKKTAGRANIVLDPVPASAVGTSSGVVVRQSATAIVGGSSGLTKFKVRENA